MSQLLVLLLARTPFTDGMQVRHSAVSCGIYYTYPRQGKFYQFFPVSPAIHFSIVEETSTPECEANLHTVSSRSRITYSSKYAQGHFSNRFLVFVTISSG